MTAATLAVGAEIAAAQGFPARPIRFVVPFAPGGTNDILARMIALRLAESLGQQIVIDNRAGAGGAIGVEIAAKSAPDGYTMVIGHIGTLAVNPTLYPKLPYDPVRDLQPITLIAKVPNLMAVHPSVPAANVREFIALAKAKPGVLSYGSGGTGGAGHLASEYFKLLTHTDILHVPYKGTGLAVLDVVSGQLAMIMAGVPGLAPYLKSGRLRAIGVSTAQRLNAFPEVPTIAESGVAGYEATQWYGILTPAATPRDVVMKLHAEIVKALQRPDVIGRLADDGATPVGNTPEEFGAYIKAEIVRWAPVVKASAARSE